MLTDTRIRNAKPKDRPYKLGDGGWLFLLVNPSGSKLWRLAYRYAGKEKLISLGAYPEVPLKEARDKRDEARRLIEAGRDPSQERKLEKIAHAEKVATTFSVVAEEYLAKCKGEGLKETTLGKKRWLVSQAAPQLDHRPISEIQPKEILVALEALDKADKLDTARRCRATIAAVFRYAISKGHASHNPTSELKGAIRSPKTKNHAAITDPKKLAGAMRAIDGYQGQPTTVAVLKLAALLFVRPGELRLAKWSEFDFEKRTWSIPGPRMKMKRPHDVPLSRQAIEIFATAQAGDGTRRARLSRPEKQEETDQRQHPERRASPNGLLHGRGDRSRIPNDSVYASQWKSPLFGGRDRIFARSRRR